MKDVLRTERGWAGHFICANSCRFRRNTLLECGNIRIVISTVGLMEDPLREGTFMEIGYRRFFETMAFHAQRVHDRYWDADVAKHISFASQWSIGEEDADDRANDMHEEVVAEIAAGLRNGHTYLTEEATDGEE